MKQLAVVLCATFLIMLLPAGKGFSQVVKKGSTLKSFPEKIHCRAAEFNKAFLVDKGEAVQLSFSDNFNFDGKMQSDVMKYNNLQSVIIRSPNLNNAVFHLLKITAEDNSISYSGQIIDPQSGEFYLLEKDTDGAYSFVKNTIENVRPVCNQN